jgi:hypothetical protein
VALPHAHGKARQLHHSHTHTQRTHRASPSRPTYSPTLLCIVRAVGIATLHPSIHPSSHPPTAAAAAAAPPPPAPSVPTPAQAQVQAPPGIKHQHSTAPAPAPPPQPPPQPPHSGLIPPSFLYPGVLRPCLSRPPPSLSISLPYIRNYIVPPHPPGNECLSIRQKGSSVPKPGDPPRFFFSWG